MNMLTDMDTVIEAWSPSCIWKQPWAIFLCSHSYTNINTTSIQMYNFSQFHKQNCKGGKKKPQKNHKKTKKRRYESHATWLNEYPDCMFCYLFLIIKYLLKCSNLSFTIPSYNVNWIPTFPITQTAECRLIQGTFCTASESSFLIVSFSKSVINELQQENICTNSVCKFTSSGNNISIWRMNC